MKLYADPTTVNGRKVVAGLNLIDAEYILEPINFFAGDHKQPAFLEINPNGEVPALVDGDLKLWESNAILIYACEKLGNLSAYPADIKIRADINRWLLWECGKWSHACSVYLHENVVKIVLGEKPDEAALTTHAPVFHARSKILEAALQGNDWLCDDHATIADIAIAAPMHYHVPGFQKLPLADYPNISAWISRVVALPCWQKSDPVQYFPQEVLDRFS